MASLGSPIWKPLPCPSTILAIIGNHRQHKNAMPEYMTIAEVCQLLRLSERTVYSLCRSGKLAGSFKVGRQWRVERTALEGWVRRCGEAPTDAPERPEEAV